MTLRVDSPQAYVNEPITAHIEIEGFSNCEEPVFPSLPGCTVQGRGVTRQGMVINNRRQTEDRTYSFEIVPSEVGRLAIPAIDVKVDGETLRTRPMTLTVNPSNVEELLVVEVSSPATRVFVGQRVNLKLIIWLKPAQAGGRPLSGRDMFSFIERNGFGPFPLPQRVAERPRRSPTGETESYYAYETSADIVVSRPGPLTLDDVGIVVNYPRRFGRDFWGDLTVTGHRRLFGRPRIEAVEVLPLPAEGRPDGFDGAVGKFGITVSATPTTVRVGDPIELTIELRGDGELETLRAPRLATNAALTRDFRVPDEVLAGDTQNGRRRFTETIRAARADVREIPAIEYPYFDPEHGEYRIARSSSIPIEVEEASELEAAALTAGPTTDDRERTADLAPLDGLRGNETDETLLLSATASPRIEIVLATTLTPPAVFFVGWLFHAFVQRRGNDEVRRRRQHAARAAHRRLNAARPLPPRERAAAVAAALGAYLADRLNDPPARFVGRAAVDALRARNATAPLAARWTALLDRCEAESFGAGGDGDDDGQALTREAAACLEDAERERL